MLKIYGADLSTPANKVRMLANALGLEFEYIQVKIREGEHKKPEYLKINPVGKVPAIDDNGFTMFESDAICKYLARKEKAALYPSEIDKRAIVDQWIDFATIHVNGAMGRVLFNRVFYKLANIEQDERSLQDGLKFLDRFLPVIENQLANNKYLAGEEFTLADIVLLSALDPAEVAQIDLSAYPSTIKWRNELKQQEFYTKCYGGKEYGEPLKQMA